MAPLRAIATLTCLAGGALSSPNVSQSHFQRYAAGQERVGNWSAAADDRHDARRQRAKNVILFIADGNGISSNYATRLWEGQHPPVNGFGDEHILAHEKMPYLALSKTYNTNAQTPDSAGTATALNSGVKTRSGILGLDENARNSRCEDVPISRVTSFAKTCKEMGKRVGIVTTARVTHATPGAVYAHSVNRNYEANVPVGCEEFQSDIAMQLIDEMIGATPMVDFALGGGREMFLPATASNTTTQASGQREGGVREDGINLVERFMAAGGAYANDRASFEALPLDASVPVLGLFQSSHMLYEHDRELQTNPEPSLKEMTVAAVQALEANNDQGYYLMVEGGRVDHANHAGNLFRTVTDGVAYQDAVQWVMDHVDPAETLVISTADHSHGLEFNGYCGRGSPIEGLCFDIDPEGEMHTDEPVLGTDGLPFTVVGFLNGAGSILQEGGPNEIIDGARPTVSQEEASAPDYEQQSLIPKDSETHSATDVAIYAMGPSAHLIDGTMEQNEIYHVMLHAILVEAEDDATKQRLYPPPTTATGLRTWALPGGESHVAEESKEWKGGWVSVLLVLAGVLAGVCVGVMVGIRLASRGRIGVAGGDDGYKGRCPQLLASQYQALNDSE